MPYRLLFLLFLVLSSLSHAEDVDGSQCRGHEDFLKEPITVDGLLENLFTQFEALDRYGKKIKFHAESIKLENNEIIFENPRLNKRVISYQYSICKRSKKNFFGYEICQELEAVEVADKLCRELGLSGASEAQKNTGGEVVTNTNEPFSYQYQEGKWESLKLWSALAPRIRHTRLKTLRCRL